MSFKFQVPGSRFQVPSWEPPHHRTCAYQELETWKPGTWNFELGTSNPRERMKPPPFLLGTALLFWGWQTGLLLPGALMGVIIESAQVFRARWDLTDDDFGRIWSFCSLLLLGAVVFAFTANEGPSSFTGLFEDPGLASQRNASLSGARTATSVLRWLPMIYFPFLAAQTFSSRETIPLATISHILQRRWKQAKRLGRSLPASRGFNIGYSYFSAALLAASFHAAENTGFFWGLCGLIAWVLWAHRSRRYALWVWAVALGVAVGLGFLGQHGIGVLQRYDFINPQWLAYFLRRHPNPAQSRTALGRVGEIKLSDKIVIRIQPRHGPVPTYLRESSYRLYKGQIWYAGSSRDSFSDVREDPPDSGNRQLLDGKTDGSCVSIACYLEGFDKGSAAGLLPLPSGCYRLERLPAYLLSKNTAGAVLANGPGLMIFDALYGPGRTIDSPPGTGSDQRVPPGQPEGSATAPTNYVPPARYWVSLTNEDLVVPDREEAALDQVIAELKLRDQPRDEQVRTLSRFFAEQFTYSLWQESYRKTTGTNETPLSRFLLQTRKGHCEFFATGTVLLLRRLGIPARYATGYAVHESAGSGYVVRLADAHAWTLLWDEDQQIWTDFETTPASWIEIEGKHRSMFRWLTDAWSRLGFEFSKFRWGQSKVRQYLLWIIVPGLVLLLYQIIFRRRRKQQAALKADAAFLANWPGLDSEFYQLEKHLSDRGVPRRACEPLNEWLERVVSAPGLAELRGPLRELLRLHYRHRFDPLGLGAEDRVALRERTRECLEKLSVPKTKRAGAASGPHEMSGR
jgi:protein-glutamine gamma-glutamyltransferase